MSQQRIVDLIPVSRRRRGRSPRKTLAVLRQMAVAEGLVEKQGAYRNARRQARADAKGVA